MRDEYLHIGLDIGSVSVNTVLMKPDAEILEEHYTRIRGQPVVRTREVLLDVLSRCPSDHPIAVSTRTMLIWHQPPGQLRLRICRPAA